MNILYKLKKIKTLLEDLQNSENIVNYEKIKDLLENLINSLFKNNIINVESYSMLINKLKNKKTANIIKDSSIKGGTIIFILLACISLINAGEIKNNNIKNSTLNQSINYETSNTILINKSYDFIKKYEGKILGDVYDNNGKIIAKNVHIVYDDKIANGKPNKKWDGKPETLNDFIKNCKGKPTVGFGITNKKKIQRGWLTEQEAEKETKNHLKNLIVGIKDKIGDEYWKQLNENQQVALISLFYNTGLNINTPNLIKFIKLKNYKNAAKEFLDIIKSDGKILNGLINRRKQEAKLFLTPIK